MWSESKEVKNCPLTCLINYTDGLAYKWLLLCLMHSCLTSLCYSAAF
jgi:hypothetical protein